MTRIFDLTNYRETSSQNIPEGRYTVLVEDAVVEQSKAGNDMAVMTLRVQAPGEAEHNSVLIDRLTFTEKAAFKVVDFMQAAGLYDPRNGKRKYDIDKLVPTFSGRLLQVDVADGQPYNGRIKSEVQGYFAAPKSGTGSAEVTDLGEETDTDEVEGFQIPDTPEQINLDDLADL